MTTDGDAVPTGGGTDLSGGVALVNGPADTQLPGVVAAPAPEGFIGPDAACGLISRVDGFLGRVPVDIDVTENEDVHYTWARYVELGIGVGDGKSKVQRVGDSA